MLKVEYFIKPLWSIDRVNAVEVTFSFDKAISKGEVLLTRTMTAASIPCCDFEGEFVVIDSIGEVDIEFEEVQGEYTHVKEGLYYALRDIVGPIKVTYVAKTRILPKNYTSSPYFDLRDEEGGANGAGWTFLIFPKDDLLDYKISWDYSVMPEGSACISDAGLNEDIIGISPSNKLAFEYFAFGKLNIWQDPSYKAFTFVWFGEAGIDVEALAEYVQKLYKPMSEFFETPNAKYTVYARKDPFLASGGGTALGQAFMFGYSGQNPPELGEVKNLLAHEMVHNWPRLTKTKSYENWYSEGTAEYYCMVLPYRFGLITKDEFILGVNNKVSDYYSNKYRDMPEEDASKIYWLKRDTQRLPYGRGLLYMMKMDSEIREESNGEYCIDNVVIDILRKEKAGEETTVDTWLELCSQYTKKPVEELKVFYEKMQKGEILPIPDKVFGNEFRVVKFQSAIFDVGFDYDNSFRNSSLTICGVEEDGPAYIGGLRSGDILKEAISPRQMQKENTTTVKLIVMKEGLEQEVTYLAEGKVVPCWKIEAKG